MRFSAFRFGQASADLSRALLDLSNEVKAGSTMRIRITEPVFFQGRDRKEGDVLEHIEVGPFRTQVIPGGLQRIPQFVEMPEEIKQVLQAAAQPAVEVPVPAVVVPPPLPPPLPQAAPPAPPPPPPAPVPAASRPAKPNPLAARVRALTARRAKFQDFAASLLDTGEHHMTEIENKAPEILTKAVNNAKDEIDAIVDLDDAMKQFAAGNGGDPL
jgi:hypothetical protein